MKADTSNKNRLVLFVRSDCEFCVQAMGVIEEVREDVEISIYRIFPSRVKDKTEIRRLDGSDAGLPLLVKSDEIPGPPVLFDPVEDEMIVGVSAIEEYLIETGLIIE